nr:MAG TPA: Cas system-associated protein [Caudoviricetes sp.]
MDKKNRCHICGKPINLEDYEPTYEIPLLMKSDQHGQEKSMPHMWQTH